MAIRSRLDGHEAAARRDRQPAIRGADDISDMTCAIGMEVAQTASRAAEHAVVLASIGAQAFEAAGVLNRDASSHELLRKAHEVRGLVAHALGVLADLQFQAGRMQALAAIRQSTGESADD